MKKKKAPGKWVKWTPEMRARYIKQFMTVGIPVIEGVTVIWSDDLKKKKPKPNS